MVNGCKKVISMDRLKLRVIDKPIPSSHCYPPPTQSTEATPSESQKITSDFKTITHSGCHMRWPEHPKHLITILGCGSCHLWNIERTNN